ncbi:MAG: RNA pseudouridine synthase [Bdellovibrionota bacterium]
MSRTEFKILKEGDFWAAVFKPPGVHSDEIALGRGESSPLLPVHRLDKETQGILLLATSDKWQEYHSLFKDGASSANKTQKLYIAYSTKEVPTGHYSGFIGSRYRSSKKTRYEEEREVFKGYHSVLSAEHIIEKSSVLNAPHFVDGFCYEIQLFTGRRHQIRAFFASYEAPLVGDLLYGAPETNSKLALFSWKLRFEDPVSNSLEEICLDPSLLQIV